MVSAAAGQPGAMLLLLALILLIIAVGLGAFVKAVFFLIAILAAVALVGHLTGRASRT
jgi:hypothetical protein